MKTIIFTKDSPYRRKNLINEFERYGKKRIMSGGVKKINRFCKLDWEVRVERHTNTNT
jgi:hypothetical protein